MRASLRASPGSTTGGVDQIVAILVAASSTVVLAISACGTPALRSC